MAEHPSGGSGRAPGAAGGRPATLSSAAYLAMRRRTGPVTILPGAVPATCVPAFAGSPAPAPPSPWMPSRLAPSRSPERLAEAGAAPILPPLPPSAMAADGQPQPGSQEPGQQKQQQQQQQHPGDAGFSGPPPAKRARRTPRSAGSGNDPSKRFKCDWDGCTMAFARASKLSRHRASHTGEKRFHCEWDGCSAAFYRREHMQRHMLTHTGEKKFQCPECSARFQVRHHLKRHLNTHANAMPFACPEASCAMTFAKELRLKIHVMEEHNGPAAYECDVDGCQDAFRTKDARRKHRRLVHEPKQHLCGSCDTTFARFVDLQQHMKTEHPSTHECGVCGRQFATERRLGEHLRTHDPDRQVVPCTVDGCDRTFFTTDGLKYHITTFHEGKRPFTCHVCAKSFTTKGSLNRHERTHDPTHQEKVAREREERRTEREVADSRAALTGRKRGRDGEDGSGDDDVDGVVDAGAGAMEGVVPVLSADLQGLGSVPPPSVVVSAEVQVNKPAPAVADAGPTPESLIMLPAGGAAGGASGGGGGGGDEENAAASA